MFSAGSKQKRVGTGPTARRRTASRTIGLASVLGSGPRLRGVGSEAHRWRRVERLLVVMSGRGRSKKCSVAERIHAERLRAARDWGVGLSDASRRNARRRSRVLVSLKVQVEIEI